MLCLTSLYMHLGYANREQKQEPHLVREEYTHILL